MGKRKREEPDVRQSVKQRRIHHKVKLGVTKLGHAFKVSKGFERQKLGRRRKNAAAQDNAKDVKRIDSEIVALKALDTTASAQQHFFKSLLKIKNVSDHPNLPSEVKKPVKLPTDTATLNVNARLCKANQVTDALSSAVIDIQQALGLDVAQSKPRKKRRLRAADFVSDNATQSDISTAGGERRKLSTGENGRDGNQSSDHRSEDKQPGVLNERIDFSSDEAAAEDQDVAALERRLASEGIKRKSANSKPNRYSFEADLSISWSEAEAQSASPEPPKARPSKKSSFIPSLTMAGYVSGSGSDIDDDIDVGPKKNRRGQRARQQIWEKKFGSKAKHLQRQGRKEGWDPKRGAVDVSGGRSTRSRYGGEARLSPDYTLGGNGDQRKASMGAEMKKQKRKDDMGPIHPSWEAAKKAKEKKDAPVAFKGKKIAFD